LVQEGREPPREGHPITGDEQIWLLARLPLHLARLALFALNTGSRDQEAVRLRWSEEVPLPAEIPGGIFVLPRGRNKNRKVKRVLFLNSIARSVVDACRGDHPEYVFAYRGHPVTRVVNKAWMRAREAAGLPGLRYHDLHHTYATRLRAIGVGEEDRADLLGRQAKDITGLYSDAEIMHLLEQAEKLAEARSGKSPAMMLLKRVSNG
jgi:integrase